MSSPTVALMKQYGVPLTVANFLYLEFMGKPPDSLEEISIPFAILRAERAAAKAFDTNFLKSIGVRGKQ